MAVYRGTEGARPFVGAGQLYAQFRESVTPEFMALLGQRLGWKRTDRILDLGAGPGQLSLLAAPLVAEVVAIEPEPDMLAEGEMRVRAAAASNVTFIPASSDDLAALRPTLGRFRSVLMGRSFHWMVDQDRVLRDLSAMVDETDGSVAFVRPIRISVPEPLASIQKTVHEILERYLVTVPRGPHSSGPHDQFEGILSQSPFSRVETVHREFDAPIRPTIESLVGAEYTVSYVLSRLGDRRAEFEREVRRSLGNLSELGEIWVRRRDNALIGRRPLTVVGHGV